MATHTESQVDTLRESALEHLWVYLREPSDMAEKGEPQIFVSGSGVHVTDGVHVFNLRGGLRWRRVVRVAAERRG